MVAAKKTSWEKEATAKKPTPRGRSANASITKAKAGDARARKEEALAKTYGASDATVKKLAARTAKGQAAAVGAATAEPTKAPPKGWKPPKSLAAGADAYFEARTARLAMEKTAAGLEEVEQAYKNWLIKNLPKDDASGIAGKLARVAVVLKDIPVVSDWNVVYGNIVAEYLRLKKKGAKQEAAAFSLLNRAISASVVKEQWKDGKTVPGVSVFHKADLSVSKL